MYLKMNSRYSGLLQLDCLNPFYNYFLVSSLQRICLKKLNKPKVKTKNQ